MNTNPKVRLLKAWQTYSKGALLEPNGTLRDWLVRSGYGEIVPPAPPVAKLPEPPVEVPADPAPQTKSRKRAK